MGRVHKAGNGSAVQQKEFAMFLLHIDATLKPGRKEDFLKVFNSLVLPLLKKQDGFVDEILLFEDGTNRGMGLSFWETREEAEQYQNNVFGKAKSNVEHLLEGKVTVRSFEVAASEIFQIKARKAA
jgi:heme-degrading monooxygenase HmoA